MRPKWSSAYDSVPVTFHPKDSREGYIQLQNSTRVLTFKNDVINFEEKMTDLNPLQKWKLGRKDKNGWHTIQHSSTKEYLTTRSAIKYGYLTMETKGMSQH